MKTKTIPVLLLLVSIIGNAQQIPSEKTRLIILADMGNEPDEEQQMMHLLMYSNEFDLEGLIAVTGLKVLEMDYLQKALNCY